MEISATVCQQAGSGFYEAKRNKICIEIVSSSVYDSKRIENKSESSSRYNLSNPN